MTIEKAAPQAFEWAARSMYEEFYGPGTWTQADAEARGRARHVLRVVVARLEKYGVELSTGADASPKPAAKATPPATSRPPAPVKAPSGGPRKPW